LGRQSRQAGSNVIVVRMDSCTTADVLVMQTLVTLVMQQHLVTEFGRSRVTREMRLRKLLRHMMIMRVMVTTSIVVMESWLLVIPLNRIAILVTVIAN
jgi:prophage DNA circulation protein